MIPSVRQFKSNSYSHANDHSCRSNGFPCQCCSSFPTQGQPCSFAALTERTKTELVLNSSIGRNRCTRSHTGCCSHKLLGQLLEFKKDCCILYTCPTCYEHYMKVARRYKHDKVNPGTQKPSIKQISRAVTREFSSNCNILQQPHAAPIIANRPLNPRGARTAPQHRTP